MIAVRSEIVCPFCGSRSAHDMPTDACQFFLECPVCRQMLRPKPGDCCVFCSWGDTRCPPQQSACCGTVETVVARTERLVIRRLTLDDAEFILGLLNEPSFLRWIGDKGVRTLDDARAYLRGGPLASYERFGFGLYLTTLADGGAAIGISGLLKRDALEDVDIGFAFLPPFRGSGYAFEAASAVMAHARGRLGLRRVVAIVSPGNERSVRLLERLGLRYERAVKLAADSSDVELYASDG